jgi:histidine ammonia-lyase
MKHLPHRYSGLFKGLFFESIAAVTSTKGHLLDVPLINRGNFAGLRLAFAIDKTQILLCQHGAGKKEPTAITVAD